MSQSELKNEMTDAVFESMMLNFKAYKTMAMYQAELAIFNVCAYGVVL